MRLKNLVITIAFFALVVLSAIAQDVRYNFDRNVDFSKYKTYKWVQIKGADQLNDMAERQLKAVVEAELLTKGLHRVDSDDADLYIGYQVAIGQEKQFTSYSTGWGYGPGWGGYWHGGMGTSSTYGTTSTIQIGQLDLEMFDRSAQTMVWRCSASKTLDTKAKPDKQEKNLKKAIAKMFKKYPPTVK